MMNARWIRLVCTVVLLIGAGRAARACSCMSPTPVCAVYFGTPAIFRGLVVERVLERPPVQTAHNQDGGTLQIIEHDRYRVTFAVSETFRGNKAVGGQVTVYTQEESSACGFNFEPGTEYVVFAHENRDGSELWTSHCSLTHAVRNLTQDEDVQWMRALATAPAGARIFGAVRLGRDETPPHTTIGVHGPVNRNVSTDDAGKYNVTGLPPGEYTVAATMPSGFASDPPRTTKLADKACAEVDWYAYYDAHVRGRVVEAGGKPVPELYMQLQHRDANSGTDFDTSAITSTDAEGRYDFSRVPPGEYFVLANSHAETPDVPYPKVYFPASPTIENATTIQVRASESLNDINVELPRAWKKVNVSVKVVLEDGTPAPGLSVDANSVADLFTVFPITAVTGPDGTATLSVYQGQEYYATALRNDTPQHCGGPVRFLAKAGQDIPTIRIEYPLNDCLVRLDP